MQNYRKFPRTAAAASDQPAPLVRLKRWRDFSRWAIDYPKEIESQILR
jgi:hypothetical protein